MLFRFFTILTVLVLAVSTWYLSNPGRTPTQSVRGHNDSPGYFLKSATLTDFTVLGDPSLKIGAERIDQIGHGNEVVLQNVRVAYQAPGGQQWLMTGDIAHLEPGGNIVDMNGNVRIEGTDAMHPNHAIIRTDTLSYDVSAGIASTKSDIKINFGEQVLNARGLVANLKEHTVHLESRVNGRFFP
jgi:LPS export ABC transporter protein LptC